MACRGRTEAILRMRTRRVVSCGCGSQPLSTNRRAPWEPFATTRRSTGRIRGRVQAGSERGKVRAGFEGGRCGLVSRGEGCGVVGGARGSGRTMPSALHPIRHTAIPSRARHPVPCAASGRVGSGRTSSCISWSRARRWCALLGGRREASSLYAVGAYVRGSWAWSGVGACAGLGEWRERVTKWVLGSRCGRRSVSAGTGLV
jgi:hypothetical protein